MASAVSRWLLLLISVPPSYCWQLVREIPDWARDVYKDAMEKCLQAFKSMANFGLPTELELEDDSLSPNMAKLDIGATTSTKVTSMSDLAMAPSIAPGSVMVHGDIRDLNVMVRH
jgi:hypothetical protein